jgi:hypothetical protein
LLPAIADVKKDSRAQAGEPVQTRGCPCGEGGLVEPEETGRSGRRIEPGGAIGSRPAKLDGAFNPLYLKAYSL